MLSYIPYIFMVYGELLFIGGLIGFFQTGSQMSLIMGALSALVSTIAGVGMLRKWVLGHAGALLMSALFTGFFAYRYMQTGKVMPGAIFAILSALMFVGLLFYNRSMRR